MKIAKLAKTMKSLTDSGYRRDKALLVVSLAFGLSPEQIAILDQLTKPDLNTRAG